MKKTLLVLILVVLSSFSFAERRNRNDDPYDLYKNVYKAVESPEMHKSIDMKSDEIQIVKDIINKAWYELKVLEVEKLKHVFAIDKLLMDGPGNKEKIDEHFEEIIKISDQMTKIYENTKQELRKHIDVDKLE